LFFLDFVTVLLLFLPLLSYLVSAKAYWNTSNMVACFCAVQWRYCNSGTAHRLGLHIQWTISYFKSTKKN